MRGQLEAVGAFRVTNSGDGERWGEPRYFQEVKMTRVAEGLDVKEAKGRNEADY